MEDIARQIKNLNSAFSDYEWEFLMSRFKIKAECNERVEMLENTVIKTRVPANGRR